MKSEIKSFNDRMLHLRSLNHQTDVYIDRYHPISVLTLINDVMSNSITDYMDRKTFLEVIKAKFDDVRMKIIEEEASDRVTGAT